MTALGGVPPPLVFDFGRFVAWTEVLRDCIVQLGVLVKSWVRRVVSWTGSGLLLDILVGFWQALGLLGCLGWLLGAPAPSLALLGGS